MEFKDKKSIFIQISEFIMENILKEKWCQGDRIPSVRELAVEMEVNPNTIMRSYSLLQEKGIIFNKRGIGYFVSDDAKLRAAGIKKDEFIQNDLPLFFKAIDMLEIDFKTIEEMYNHYKKQETG